MTGRVHLPHSDLDVSPLQLGGNVFGWTADAETSAAVLDAFLDAGGNTVDTADSYTWRVEGNSGGDSERVLGDWMASRGVRDRVVVATKVGAWPERPGLSEANVRAACADSCRRLRTDHVDLYYAHRDDPDTPLEETLVAFDALVRSGEIRAYGLSNYTADRLTTALEIVEGHGLTPPAALQPHYNLVERAEYEDELAPVVERAGMGCFPYFGLAKGFLTGKYRSSGEGSSPASGGAMSAAREEGARAYLSSGGERVLDVLDEVASGHGVPAAAVALAWLAAQPSVTAPIASARTVSQLADVLPMMSLTLGDDELGALTSASEESQAG